jgi:hypothetical protein
MPLYVYAFPVTAVAALLLSLAGQVLGGSSGQISAPFGWLRTGMLKVPCDTLQTSQGRRRISLAVAC